MGIVEEKEKDMVTPEEEAEKFVSGQEGSENETVEESGKTAEDGGPDAEKPEKRRRANRAGRNRMARRKQRKKRRRPGRRRPAGIRRKRSSAERTKKIKRRKR